MHKYDYSFLKHEVSGRFIGLTEIISDLNAKEEFRKLQYSDAFDSLREKALVESVEASNAIEGIVSTKSRIEDIVSGAAPVTHDEKEISGYKDALAMIHEAHDHIDLNEDLILLLHRMIQQQTDIEKAGKYKKTDNLIMEYDNDGNRHVRFRPVAANDVKQNMEQMMLAYYEARQDSEISPLLLIPCLVLDFLCIHPFNDGNGRISRIINILLLYQSGYDIVKYVSLENQINKYRYNYYEALRDSSDLWHENGNDYTPFITFSLQIIYKCFKELDGSFSEISLKKAKKSERVEAVLMDSVVPVSKHEIKDRLPDVSVKTIELVLNKMMKEKKIKKIGTFKNARYMRNYDKGTGKTGSR